jgi:hypothetical protein
MGNIGSHVNITSAWHGHQAKNEALADTHPIFKEPKPGRSCALPGSLPANGYHASPVGATGMVFLLTQQGKATVVKTGTDWKILTLNDLESGCRACHPGSQALQRFLLDEHSRLAESLNPTEGDLLTVSPYRER